MNLTNTYIFLIHEENNSSKLLKRTAMEICSSGRRLDLENAIKKYSNTIIVNTRFTCIAKFKSSAIYLQATC